MARCAVCGERVSAQGKRLALHCQDVMVGAAVLAIAGAVSDYLDKHTRGTKPIDRRAFETLMAQAKDWGGLSTWRPTATTGRASWSIRDRRPELVRCPPWKSCSDGSVQ